MPHPPHWVREGIDDSSTLPSGSLHPRQTPGRVQNPETLNTVPVVAVLVAEGTYTLLVRLGMPTTLVFGAAGSRDLEAGWYAYTGSAFGPGGLQARVARHRELARGEREVRHWHVDHLLGAGTSRLGAVFRTPERRIECEVHRGLAGEPVDGLGASDCACATHLRYAAERERLAVPLAEVHELGPGDDGPG